MSDRPWQLVAASSARRDIQSLPEKYAAAVPELLPIIAANPKRLGKPLRFEYEGRAGGSSDARRADDQVTCGTVYLF